MWEKMNKDNKEIVCNDSKAPSDKKKRNYILKDYVSDYLYSKGMYFSLIPYILQIVNPIVVNLVLMTFSYIVSLFFHILSDLINYQ